ncbi:lipopolysaccharide biosynthesis protein [Streptomyces sp. RerS4]|uniref:lipopolysaccharide biosynthesis protein n=1 Tax=Streptomyces sp. RerS4 TaxID=2942449 RepID=UPI00201C0D6A|nr:lipopolysaccharide biosynthesis protein [Streptomyces sp. RerS4]UQX01552.1 lipopolysaccharide biosynthesis protein [Streptomyces sp. RerS4]
MADTADPTKNDPTTSDQKEGDHKTSDRKKAAPKSAERASDRKAGRRLGQSSDHRSGRRRGRLLPPPAWWPLPACALLGLAAGGAYGVLKAPEYAATSYVVAVPDDTTEPATALGFAQAYARIATSSSTLAYAQPRAGIDVRKLRSQVRAETSPESPMIAITGTSGSAGEAADIANAVADALSLSSNQAAKNTGVQLLLFNQAVAPTEPASPSAAVSGAVGLCAGGLLGGLWLLARPGRRRPQEVRERAVVGEYASLPAQGEPASTKEKESVR